MLGSSNLLKQSKFINFRGLGLQPQFLPTTGAGFRDRVVRNQIAGQRARRAVIEQNQHYERGAGASALCAAN